MHIFGAKSLQSCPSLCDPIDGSPRGSTIPGILQARTLEWVAISFSNAWKWKVKVKSLSRVRLIATPWTAAYQAPPSMGFSRQEYWSGVPLPSPPSHLILSYLQLMVIVKRDSILGTKTKQILREVKGLSKTGVNHRRLDYKAHNLFPLFYRPEGLTK